MVQGQFKSRKRFKRVQVRTSGGNTVTHYRQKTRKANRCAVTKKPLQGIPRLTNRKFKNLNKSKKTISRPYGGYMSHRALKEKILNDMIFEDQK